MLGVEIVDVVDELVEGELLVLKEEEEGVATEVDVEVEMRDVEDEEDVGVRVLLVWEVVIMDDVVDLRRRIEEPTATTKIIMMIITAADLAMADVDTWISNLSRQEQEI